MATTKKKPAPKTEAETQLPDDGMMTATTNSDEKSPMLELGGLWINESQSGKKYMSGYFGNLKIMIFRNTFKKKDNEPDYRMMLVEKQRDTDSDAEKEKTPDDIPF